MTLSDAGQNRTSVDVKFTPLDWSPALYSWQRRSFPAELHQLCVNNQGLTCRVKPRNWSDTSKRRLPPSLGGKTLHGASKTDVGEQFTHAHKHRPALTHIYTHRAEEGGNGVPRLDDTVWVPILSYKCFLCLSFSLVNGWPKCQIASQPQMNKWNEHVMLSHRRVLCVQPKSRCYELKVFEKQGEVLNEFFWARCFH